MTDVSTPTTHSTASWHTVGDYQRVMVGIAKQKKICYHVFKKKVEKQGPSTCCSLQWHATNPQTSFYQAFLLKVLPLSNGGTLETTFLRHGPLQILWFSALAAAFCFQVAGESWLGAGS